MRAEALTGFPQGIFAPRALQTLELSMPFRFPFMLPTRIKPRQGKSANPHKH
jgi:hypothetical protein